LARNPTPTGFIAMKTKLTLFVTVLAFCFQQSSIGADLKKGLVAYYPFNGNSLDESGNGHHAGVSGASFAVDRNGVRKSAYSFDGENDYIEINKFTWKDRKSATISVWVHYSEMPIGDKYGQIVSLNGEGHCFFLHRNQIFMRQGWGNHAVKAPEVKKWNHLIFCWDHAAPVIRGYINGQKVFENDAYQNRDLEQSPLVFGDSDRFRGQRFFKGSIDDVRIYNRALSAAEVIALYDLEKPKGK
jgi:hypothetical protein